MWKKQLSAVSFQRQFEPLSALGISVSSLDNLLQAY